MSTKPVFHVGAIVTLPTGRAAIVRSVDRARGEVEVEALPWKASFRPGHLRPAADGEALVFLNVQSTEEPEA